MVMCSGEEKYWKYYFDDVDTKTEENTECGDCLCFINIIGLNGTVYAVQRKYPLVVLTS